MRTPEPWFESAPADEPLTQGDLILGCPVTIWDPDSLAKGKPAAARSPSEFLTVVEYDVVVTQACDLEQHKVDDVVLCPHSPLSEFRPLWERWMTERGQTPSEKAWKRTCDDITAGNAWNHAMLDGCDLPGLESEVRVVDFHYVFTAPRLFLEALLSERAQPRPRLLPPYREHLSQAFARFFMRVGLPQPVRTAWKDRP